MDNNALLVAAKGEYTRQLRDAMIESMYIAFLDIWQKSEGESPLKVFQKNMCDIPLWNQMVIDNHVKDIVDNHKISIEFLDKLIEAVFLSNIKILSVVKLTDRKHVVNVKVPSTRNFIHKCYIECARSFYTKPKLFDDRHQESNIKESLVIITDCIDKTIRNLIPMEAILNEYLNSDNEDEVEPTPEPTSEQGQEQVSEPEIEEPEIEQEENYQDNSLDEEFMKQPEVKNEDFYD